MTPKVFTKLLGFFVLLLAVYSLVMALVIHLTVEHAGESTARLLIRECLWCVVVVLAIAIPAAGWLSSRVSDRLERIVTFNRRIAQGDLSVRLSSIGKDEFSAMESSLESNR